MTPDTRNAVLPSEHSEQAAFVSWLRLNHIPHAAVPNGGKRNMVTASLLKAEGVSKGFPDLLVFLPTVTVAVEMKARHGSKVSAEQKSWIEYLDSRPGWRAVVSNGAEEAIKMIVGMKEDRQCK